jgi:DNA-binding transcriptional LysR family regulator
MRLINLDMDLLRTLAVATELGGLARAAERLGRSPSAISLQMQKLEDQVGRALFRREGRKIGLTDCGDILLTYAQRILALNDEAVAVIQGIDVEGVVRLGVPFDFTERWLPPVLARLTRAYPKIRVELRADRSIDLMQKLATGALDLVMAYGPIEHFRASLVAELPLVWIGSPNFHWPAREPVPLILLDPPCCFRQMALDGLEQNNVPWRLAFTSPSLAAVWAATEAAIGISLRTPLGLPNFLRILDDGELLPKLSNISLGLYSNGDRTSSVKSLLETILLETLKTALPHAAVRLSALSKNTD